MTQAAEFNEFINGEGKSNILLQNKNAGNTYTPGNFNNFDSLFFQKKI